MEIQTTEYIKNSKILNNVKWIRIDDSFKDKLTILINSCDDKLVRQELLEILLNLY